MAVAIWGFTVVIPLQSIQLGYPGGLQGWLELVAKEIGHGVWLDDRLAAIYCFDPTQSFDTVQHWYSMGFSGRSSGPTDKDDLLCAQVDSQLGLTISPECDWLEFDPAFPCAWRNGEPRGSVAVPAFLRDKLPVTF